MSVMKNMYRTSGIYMCVDEFIKICPVRNLEVDGCPLKENLFGKSALLINATYNFPYGDL